MLIVKQMFKSSKISTSWLIVGSKERKCLLIVQYFILSCFVYLRLSHKEKHVVLTFCVIITDFLKFIILFGKLFKKFNIGFSCSSKITLPHNIKHSALPECCSHLQGDILQTLPTGDCSFHTSAH